MTMDLDRRTLIGGLTVGAAGLVIAPRLLAADIERRRSFVVIGDWGRGTEAQHRVAAEMGRTAAATDARFVLAVGDNFYDQGVDSIDDPLWKAMFEDVYTHPALQVPWHAALGNHDYGSNPQAQVDYTSRSPRWRMPERYYKLVDSALDDASDCIVRVVSIPQRWNEHLAACQLCCGDNPPDSAVTRFQGGGHLP